MKGGSGPQGTKPEALKPDRAEVMLGINIAMSVCWATLVYSQEYLMGKLWSKGFNLWREKSANLGVIENITPSEFPGYVLWEYLSYVYDRHCCKGNIHILQPLQYLGILRML